MEKTELQRRLALASFYVDTQIKLKLDAYGSMTLRDIFRIIERICGHCRLDVDDAEVQLWISNTVLKYNKPEYTPW